MKKVLALLIFTLLLSCNFENNDVDLNANVEKSITHLTVSNNDSFDYSNGWITINSTYEYKFKKLSKGKNLKIILIEFADSNGVRFNPISNKILSVSIYCDVLDGKTGYMYGEFE